MKHLCQLNCDYLTKNNTGLIYSSEDMAIKKSFTSSVCGYASYILMSYWSKKMWLKLTTHISVCYTRWLLHWFRRLYRTLRITASRVYYVTLVTVARRLIHLIFETAWQSPYPIFRWQSFAYTRFIMLIGQQYVLSVYHGSCGVWM